MPAPTPLVLSAILSALLLAAPAAAQSLELRDSTRIRDKAAGFDEPSGLSLSADGGFLWAVSDNAPEVFRLGFDGKLIPGPRPRLPWPDQAEGVAATPDGTGLVVVREDGARVALIDIAGGETRIDHALRDMEGWDDFAALLSGPAGGKDENGLEGVAIAPLDGTVWLLREAEPRLLIALSPDLARIVSVRRLDAAAGFDDAMDRDGRLDVSGIAVAAAGFWIVSDRGRRVFLLPRDGGAGPALSWPLARKDGDDPDLLSDAEGVAWDPGRNMLFVVSDAKKKSRLVSYALTD